MMSLRIKPSPCSKCIVFPMCAEVCDDFRKYKWETLLRNKDSYAKAIIRRTLRGYGIGGGR